jgi:hypothetical protein
VIKMSLGIMGLGMACTISDTVIYLGNLVYPLFIPEIRPALLWPGRSSFKGFK